MTKKLVLVSLLLALGKAVYSQAYYPGVKIISARVGLLSTLAKGAEKSVVLPYIGILEYGVSEELSVGLFGGYTQTSSERDGLKYIYDYTFFGANAAYHFETIEKVDVYAGLNLGYNVGKGRVEVPAGYLGGPVTANKQGGILFGGFAGARYYPIENLGIGIEIGSSISYLQTGLTVKF